MTDDGPSVPSLVEALRTTGACRDFTDEPVADDVLARVLDTARFAPSGGNKQGWRVVVVQDPAVRRALRDQLPPGLVRLPRHDDGGRAAVGAHERPVRRGRGDGRGGRGGRVRGGGRRRVRGAPRRGAGAARPLRRPVGARRRRPRPRALLVRRRRLGVPVRLEPPARGPGRRARWRHHDDGHPPRGRGEGAPARARPRRARRGHRPGSPRPPDDAPHPRRGQPSSRRSTRSTARRSVADRPAISPVVAGWTRSGRRRSRRTPVCARSRRRWAEPRPGR